MKMSVRLVAVPCGLAEVSQRFRGYGILTAAWFFTLKSVRYLILRKGGDKLTFVTYTPFGKNRMLTVDVNKVSSQESRQNARVQLPIKVKNYRLFFVLDMKGEFQNPKLFDHTAGLKREWKT
ncbi:transmembrane protein 223 isoform X2 [Zootermopsis nevadensis]|uniref:transmembrane protein 223 isoform X2 n=1 Tax=Zootermopsis nevadensis TaxID=136037 RepID=UPI000B8EC2AF|nr:transmembrane protein 223 isoform X2 [Zootermopsis nevadensis]